MPLINIELQVRPKTIQVSREDYNVNVYVGEEFAFTLPGCYTSYQEAEQTLIKTLKENFSE